MTCTKTRSTYLIIATLFINSCGETYNVQNPIKGYAALIYSEPDDTTSDWINHRFEYIIEDPPTRNKSSKIFGYRNIYAIGSTSEYLDVKDWAISNGISYEDIILHAKINYTPRINPAFDGLDRFDAFEGANGILQSQDDITFNDITQAAYNNPVELSNKTYFGYEEPFSEINFKLVTSISGGQIAWDYWNGSNWTSIQNGFQDGTNGLKNNGRVYFWPPSDWKILSINNSRRKYFTRLTISKASTNPVSQQIYGDNWLDNTSTPGRGWDANSPYIINAGTPLAFNTQASVQSSAKLRYQARITSWSSNHFIANPADRSIGSEGTWAKWLASKIINTNKGNGIMCDDGERDVIEDGVSAENTDFIDTSEPSISWAKSSLIKYQNLVRIIHTHNNSYMIGINAADTQIAQAGQWNLIEYHTFTWKTNDLRGITIGDDSLPNRVAYDNYLNALNPRRIIGVFIYNDSQNTIGNDLYVWDRGNRGPIAALSKHYISKNDNTLFAYTSQGGYIYNESDEVILNNGSTLHQAKDPIPITNNVYRWGTYFPAMGVDIGLPDTKGFNHGARDLQWKTGVELGGRADVWRRDYTKAIVLHRPASWDTTASQYSTYSTTIQLNGQYYPLLSDGRTGKEITSIQLREGEGAILLKHNTNTWLTQN
ncbi:hypothetical protein [Leptothrix ochracea]|uniref:hypothetical protein n=1 Tax=Leptothrix ochracea TaxID=735331 RepID=UPI0034E19A71